MNKVLIGVNLPKKGSKSFPYALLKHSFISPYGDRIVTLGNFEL